MNNAEYKYDVAFSFLKEDEGLANQLNELLSDRVSTFLYSKQQEKVAGTDGEKIFNDVFSKESRIVVVLFRKNWGKTPWTRIEETAIRNRAYEEGYDFVIFVPLEIKSRLPKYLPKTQIWIGLDRWGVKCAASVIEARIQLFGGKPKILTPKEIAARIKNDQIFEQKRKLFLESVEGLELAKSEAKKLFAELEKVKNEIKEGIEGFELGYSVQENSCFLNHGWFSIKCEFIHRYRDSLADSYLSLTLQASNRSGFDSIIINKIEYHFDINKNNEYGWIKNKDRDSFVSSNQLVEEAIKILFDKINDDLDKNKSEKYI
jgi:hypothetical protein